MGTADISFPALLTLEECAQGTERTFVFARPDAVCPDCPADSPNDACRLCAGTGRALVPRTVGLRVPAGVNDQVRIRVDGQGDWDPDTAAWADLYVVCYMRSHKRLKKMGSNVITTMQRPGPRPCDVEVPTPYGLRPVHVPDDGADEVVLPGLGLPRRIGGGEPGDLIVRLLDAPSAAEEQEHRAALAEASAAMNRAAYQEVIALLQATPGHLMDTPTHVLLGVALSATGSTSLAAQHLKTALFAEPDRLGHMLHLADHALRSGRPAAACAWYEACYSRGTRAGTVKTGLAKAASELAAQARAGVTSSAGSDAISRAADAMAHRNYAMAVSVLKPYIATTTSVLVMSATAALSGAIAGLAGLAGLAADAYDMLSAPRQACAPATDYCEAFTDLALREWGLGALVAAALPRAERGDLADAVPYLRAGIRCAKRVTIAPDRDGWDELEVARLAELRLNLERLQAASRMVAGTAGTGVRLAGLAAHLCGEYAVRSSGEIRAGWPDAARAAQHLELALCMRPDDPDVRADFEGALEFFAGVATGVLAETDPDRAAFYANTRDAAIAGLIPGVARAHAPDESVLVRDVAWVFDAVFRAGRRPLRGEFLVGCCADHYALTNYRLYLCTDRLPAPQLLPLNAIERYATRVSGIGTTTAVVGLSGGRQTVLSSMPNGTFPPERLVAYFIAARMWECLNGGEAQVLSTGVARPAAAGATNAGPALAPGAGVALPAGPPKAPPCMQCGKPTRPSDRFCRACGATTPAGADPPATALIEGGP